MYKVYVNYDDFREYCDIGDEDDKNYHLKIIFQNIDEYKKYFKGISKYRSTIIDFDITFVDKIKDDNVYSSWNVYLVFDFPNEEEALYFKLKFCS